MILETKEEKEAFEFICNLASELTDRRGCNDLDLDDKNKFCHLIIQSSDTNGDKFFRKVTMDFDVIQWLRGQIKEDGKFDHDLQKM